MIVDLGELREFVGPASLKFAIAGRRYEVAPASGEAWLRLQDVSARAAGVAVPDVESIDGLSRQDLARMVLGPVYDQLLKDNTAGTDIQRAVFTAYLWQLGNDELAAAAWRDGGEGPGKAPARRGKSTSTSTATGTTTRKPASTRATRSRPTSSASSKAARV